MDFHPSQIGLPLLQLSSSSAAAAAGSLSIGSSSESFNGHPKDAPRDGNHECHPIVPQSLQDHYREFMAENNRVCELNRFKYYHQHPFEYSALSSSSGVATNLSIAHFNEKREDLGFRGSTSDGLLQLMDSTEAAVAGQSIVMDLESNNRRNVAEKSSSESVALVDCRNNNHLGYTATAASTIAMNHQLQYQQMNPGKYQMEANFYVSDSNEDDGQSRDGRASAEGGFGE